MGAGQSTETPNEVDHQTKTSYYELLGIQRQATEDEIKKAYRRKALELHPDRNYGNEEEATKTFAEVQTAYEILSDPQERAWYDSHETAILRGDAADQDDGHSYANIRVTTADDLARVVRKFNSNVEFNDASSGFFGFLSEQFEHLAKEEDAAAAWESVEVRQYPPFGHRDDTYDDVVKSFYSAWINFSTVKSFAWKDRYRVSEAPDRRIRRLMEKENNNLRQEAIREFNEAVRSFVLFVRKRDPRYQPSTQSEAERQQVLRHAAAAQRARALAANQAKMEGEVPAWAQVRNDDELDVSEIEEVAEEVIECVACNKVFKSERQYEAHERSKKHQKAVQALQKKMQRENQHLHLDDEIDDNTSDPADWDLIDGDHEHHVGSDIDNDEGAKTINVANTNGPIKAEDVLGSPTDVTGTQTLSDTQLSNEEKHTEAQQDDKASPEDITQQLETATLQDPDDDDEADTNSKTTAPKIGKAAQKRAKRAAAANTDQTENNHKCAGCNAAFPSRTQLFQHIKKHGHAALKANGIKEKKKR